MMKEAAADRKDNTLEEQSDQNRAGQISTTKQIEALGRDGA
jgi:hypothetical protein